MESGYKKIELYIHIPFCVKKCNYCDFLSFAADRRVQEEYMEALFSEIRGRAEEYAAYRVTSVFIGGGTPSIVETKWIVGLMELVRELFWLEADAEITIEVNPGTVSREKLEDYIGVGINRLSIGLQSANAEELSRLGRIHSFAAFLETYEAARTAGFKNVNVDVMSALPGQGLSSYLDTLQRVLSLTPPPEHISAYSLIVEEGTPFARWQQEGSLDVPDEECERLMYEETKRVLERAGMHRYETSNYALEGYECRHNCGYWRRVNYVGFGIGAASLVENVRFQNADSLQKYLEEPLSCRCEQHALSLQEQMEEFMFLGLRMTAGVSDKEFYRVFGQRLTEVYGQVIAKNMEEGLLHYLTGTKKAANHAVSPEEHEGLKQERWLALTDRGMDISNYVMAQFLFDTD